ncbi:hypothetical protein, partial [Agrobacterium sp.]|uniref:hypothetical protein n=1 Tax=Agrobacterium sp. TaxID=361 RepID=UPI004034BBD4
KGLMIASIFFMRKYLSASPVKAGSSRSATRMHVLCQIGSGLEEKTSPARLSGTKCIRFWRVSGEFLSEIPKIHPHFC